MIGRALRRAVGVYAATYAVYAVVVASLTWAEQRRLIASIERTVVRVLEWPIPRDER